jgi:hypothetical protein
MNIFFLSLVPALCAKWHCDKHVVKMILEGIQILYTAHHLLQPKNSLSWLETAPMTTSGHGFKKTHVKHPSVIWTTESLSNYEWLCELSGELCKEYRNRYGKNHSCEVHVTWLHENKPPYTTPNVFTAPRIAMKPHCKEYAKENNLDAVAAYHYYYINDKLGFMSYRNFEVPSFLLEVFSEKDNFEKLGLIDPLAVELVSHTLTNKPFSEDVLEAYGVDTTDKEQLIRKAVLSQHEQPKKWNEVIRNGVKITNAVARCIPGSAVVKFQTGFDKKRGKQTNLTKRSTSPKTPSPKKLKTENSER